jgi:predicted HAD superfamily Cof-like phosphohydrolase
MGLSSNEKMLSAVEELRKLLVEQVPGQLFRDIQGFHEKFGLAPTDDPGHRLPDDVLKFRIKFMFEELQEYVDAVGGSYGCPNVSIDPAKFHAEDAFDALIDLAYVALGTAYLHRFPFNEGWARVQAANMKKVRASGDDDPLSKRKHNKDVVKPPGWLPPVLTDLLDEVCPLCNGSGHHGDPSRWTEISHICPDCGGMGRRRRVPTKKETT